MSLTKIALKAEIASLEKQVRRQESAMSNMRAETCTKFCPARVTVSGKTGTHIEHHDAELRTLRAIVGKLPVDAEGKPVMPGRVVWFYDDADVLRSCFALQFVSGILDSILTAYGWVLLKYCYSTEAAARAAEGE